MSNTNQKAAVLFSATFELTEKLKIINELNPSLHLLSAIESIVSFRESVYAKIYSLEIKRLRVCANDISNIQSNFDYVSLTSKSGVIRFIINGENVNYTEYEDRHQVIALIVKHADSTISAVKEKLVELTDYVDEKIDEAMVEFLNKYSTINNNTILDIIKIKEQ